MRKASCPSCGAELEFRNAASLWIVCDHCGTMAVRHDVDLEAVGKVAQLKSDGSPVQLGTRGVFRKKGFEVVGRIQLEYPQGFWNEWFLSFADGSSGWLGEAQGDYAVSWLAKQALRLPAFENLSPGATLSIDGVEMEVRDLQRARCISGQGELPFEVRGGYEAPVADLVGPGSRFATIDFSEEPPLVFTGEYADFDELKLTDLKEIEGW
ncbi:MAG: DUF4178 domain-containing protein [Candidatus Wallbacteria bacterium]|nr:DUF4178 domain-containing protein [Candidatus Wallbacteria bacterium]